MSRVLSNMFIDFMALTTKGDRAGKIYTILTIVVMAIVYGMLAYYAGLSVVNGGYGSEVGSEGMFCFLP
ncbi:MAG: hypothetical protein CSYNP_04051 [Syntrophus sp. SKADARSKE-3]|nr:hypothetical protein [Syntrophus sp. SKADARSKE-3]